MIKKIIFLNLLLISVNSFAVEKLLYVMGGGGEPAGEATIFDEGLETLALFTKNKEWKTKVSFNGGHKVTDGIIKTKMKNTNNVGSFDEENFHRMINEMIAKLIKGELKEGDQLMLSIDSHGDRKAEKESTHSISLVKNKTTSLDRLQMLVTLAAEKKVKLAIVDLSCNSGNLLSLNNNKTCIITGAGTENYGFSSFGNKFFELMKSGKNLEDIFLESRKHDNTTDFPMISTPEGLSANFLYKKIIPFLYYNTKAQFDLELQYNDRSVDKFNESLCKMEDQFNDAIDAIRQIGDADKAAKFMLTARLEAQLTKYRNFQRKYEETLAANMKLEAAIDTILHADFPERSEDWYNVNTLDMVLTDYDTKISEIKKTYQGKKDAESIALENKLIADLKVKERVSRIVKAKLGAEFREQIANSKNFIKDVEKNSHIYAGLVSSEARLVFDSMYRANMKENETNPCRDFKL